MGIPRRDGGGGTFQVNIRPLVKTCPVEAGIGQLQLPEGTRIAVTGLHLWPNHDRGLVSAFRSFLADKRPDVIVLLGGILNEEAFKMVVNEEDRMRKLIGTHRAPEISRIRAEHEGIEDRFLALAKAGGRYIADFAEASGGHVIYVPSVPSAAGQLPNELGLLDFVLAQKEKLDAWAEKHPDEAVEGPPIPFDYAEFLGLSDNPNVTVMPFGSALEVNGSVSFIVGDFRRRNPGTASYVDVEHNGKSVVRAFDGKVASAWWTTPVHSLGDSHRKWWQAHEVGNLFDLSQLGFLRDYDRRGKGIWVGTIAGGKVFGTSIPVLTGKDGVRSIAVDGVPYDEQEKTGARSKTFTVALPSRTVTSAKTAAKPASKTAAKPAAKPAAKRTPRKRNTGRGASGK